MSLLENQEAPQVGVITVKKKVHSLFFLGPPLLNNTEP